MPNVINANGITIETLAEILTGIIDGTPDIPGLKAIYGADINVDSNSPDGQLVNIFALAKQDILDLIVQLYNSKDPDQAVGVALDGLAQLCGLARKGGSYTITDVEITVDRSLNLVGLDTPTLTPFTVADNNGNQFYLELSTALTAGTHVLSFRAANLGLVQVDPNTITVPVTITLGVTAINNPSAPTQVGTTQESDSAFRIRRQLSVSSPSQGYLESLYGGLNDIASLTDAAVYENNGPTTSPAGIPPHSIWVIVEGGTDEEIADVIYRYRNAGCGMYGTIAVNVTQVDGTLFEIKFDRASFEDLYVECHLDVISGGAIDEDAIKAALVQRYIFKLNQPADITTLATLIRSINPNVVVSEAGVSNNGSAFETIVYPTSLDKKFILTAANINFI